MFKSNVTKIAVTLSLIVLTSCASNPDDIDAAYVSPLKYNNYDCDQISTEMDHIGKRTSELYLRLKSERNKDNWQTGVGVLLFWPSLFLLEGGDGPEAQEYAQLKGEFEALRENSVTKKCGITKLSPSEIITKSEANAKERALDTVGDSGAKYSDKVKLIAEEKNCRKAVSLQEVTNESESWKLECLDDSEIYIRCFDDECYIKK